MTRGPCHAVIPSGKPAEPCATLAQPGMPYCTRHLGPLTAHRPGTAREFLAQWRRDIAAAVDSRHHTGDEGEYDPALVRALAPLALPLYSLYWRVETYGIENIPTEGPALLVANHSGTVPIDGAMLKLAVLTEHGRNPWLLAGDLAFQIPGLRRLIRVAGNARADRAESIRLLRDGEMLGVFPEGYKGIGKGWRKRYQLQRFGRGGFIELCLETGAPIVPVAIIGAEEAYPMIANAGFLARRFGVPYLPITPTWPLLGPLGAIPLPSKWIIAFGHPIPFVEHGRKAASDWAFVLQQTEDVRKTVQALINEYLPRRRRSFL